MKLGFGSVGDDWEGGGSRRGSCLGLVGNWEPGTEGWGREQVV